MKIFSNNRTIEFIVHRNGAMSKVIQGPSGTQIRTTQDVCQFVEWMTTEEKPSPEDLEREKAFKLMRMINWWELATPTYNYGFFNVDHYKKVVEARKSHLKGEWIHPDSNKMKAATDPFNVWVLLSGWLIVVCGILLILNA